MKIAKFMGEAPGEWRGDARWFRMEPPMTSGEYDFDSESEVVKEYSDVILSAAMVLFTGPETYIFPANERGEIQSWIELDGSMRGTLDHNAVLSSIGYQVRS